MKVSHCKDDPIAGKRREAFAIIDQDEFQRHSKFRKPRDLKRMLYYNTSGDWVTWTPSALLKRYAPNTWWSDLVKLAGAQTSRVRFPSGWEDCPDDKVGEGVPSLPRTE